MYKKQSACICLRNFIKESTKINKLDGDKIIPTITGEAWVMAEGAILVDERDPFGSGIG